MVKFVDISEKKPSDKLKNIMTVGIYERQAFLIKDIIKLAKTYVCNNCRARFTKACHLQRHIKTCSQGRTSIDCPNEKVKTLLTVYERTFYNKSQASQLAISWLEKTGKQLSTHIHHAMCGHGARGGYWELRWMGIPRNREQSSNTTSAGGMDVVYFLPTGTQKLPTVKREKNYTQRPRLEKKP